MLMINTVQLTHHIKKVNFIKKKNTLLKKTIID